MKRFFGCRTVRARDKGLLRLALAVLASVVVFGLPARNAFAQSPGVFAPAVPGVEAPEATVPERQSVSQRTRPDYDPLGLRAGSFLIFPSVDLDEEYNSNVYVTQTGAKSDFLTSLRPALNIASDWNTNALNFRADGEIRRYDQQVSENESNFDVASNGRLDIERDVYLTGGLGYQVAHEDRTSPNSVTGEKSPTLYELGTGDIGFVHETGTLGFRVNGDVTDYSYNNNITSTGTTIPESYRDRVEYVVTPRVSYEFIPGYSAFIKAPVNYRDYNAERDPSGFEQNSHGYEVDAGSAVGLGQIVNGEAYVGYFQQDYDAAGTVNSGGVRYGNSPSGVTFGGNVLWNVTPIDSIRGAVARSVQETILEPASSFVESDVSVTGEHELLRNVILTANLTYSNQAFQGVTRTDNIYSGGLGGRYLINKDLSAGLNATYSDRNSDVSGQSYKQTLVIANVRLQY